MTHKQLGVLAQKAGNGDVEAFASLYSHFSESIYFFALRLTKNEADANDIVQDTLLKLYNNLHNIRNPQAVTRFVNQIAYHSAMDIIKQRQNILLTEDDDVFAAVFFEETEFAPEPRLEKEENSKQIISAIDMLNDNLRTVIILYYYQQLSVKEIAETVDANESAVKMRLSRGRQELKKILSSKGFKGVITMSIILSLTRVLQTEAKAAYSDKQQRANWEQLGKSLDFSTEVVQMYSSVAIQPAKAPVNINRVVAKPLAISLTATAVVAGAVVFSRYIRPIPTQTTGNPVSSIRENTNLPSGSSENTFVDMSPAIVHAYYIEYLVNTPITPPMVIADAKIKAPQGTVLTVLDLEQVDCSVVQEYAIHLSVTGADGTQYPNIAVILAIVETLR